VYLLPFILVKQAPTPQEDVYVHEPDTVDDALEYLDSWKPEYGTLYWDIETNGLLPFRVGAKVLCIGFADSRGSICFNLRSCKEGDLYPFQVIIQRMWVHQIPVGCFNIGMEGLWALHALSTLSSDSMEPAPSSSTPAKLNQLWLNWEIDVFSTFKHVANEGWTGQQWSLKRAQVDLLGWETQGDEEIKAYRKANKLHRLDFESIPFELLGPYCALDAQSTKLLRDRVLQPVLDKHSPFYSWYKEVHLITCREICKQHLHKMEINLPYLLNLQTHLRQEIATYTDKFYAHPEVATLIAAFNQRIKDELAAKEPPKTTGGVPKKEPIKLTKRGELSKSWIAWNESPNTEIKMSKRWQIWEACSIRRFEKGIFNFNSNKHLMWLYYEQLKKDKVYALKKGEEKLVIDKNALATFGSSAKLLLEIKKRQTLLSSFIDKWIISCEQWEHPDGQVQALLYAPLKVAHAVTHRLSGGGSKQ
jgi:hypothetical protein